MRRCATRKRAAYDQLRAQGYRPGEEFHAPPNFNGGQGFDFDEIFGNGGAGGGFSDFFESLFANQRGGRARNAGPQPRGDTPGQAGGTAGSGLLRRQRAHYRQRQAAGRARAQGDCPRPGDPAGRAGQRRRQLLLEIEYAAHPQFEVDGHNILYTLQVTPWQAALGTTISVPTLGGEVELKIPAESDAGRKLRLRGRGLPGTPAGDQIVELEILAPAPTDDTQKKAYRNLAKRLRRNGLRRGGNKKSAAFAALFIFRLSRPG